MRTPKMARLRSPGWPVGWVWLYRELAGLAHPALWCALLALLATVLVVPQLPLRYGFDVGREEGLGSDLPYLRGFNTAEQDELGSYRWSDNGATILLPGIGARDVLVRLDWLPMPTVARELGPHSYGLKAGGVALGQLTLRPEGGTQLVAVPASAVVAGRLELTIQTDTFSLAGDPRNLGARLSSVGIASVRPMIVAAPDWDATLLWLLAVACAWMALRGALDIMPDERVACANADLGMVQNQALELDNSAMMREAKQRWHRVFASSRLRVGAPLLWAFSIGIVLVSFAALLDPPRWAFGAWPALSACALAYPLALVCRWALPRLAHVLAVPLDHTSRAWMTFFIVLSFAMRFGGRLYPDSMPGDLGFHHNRFNEAVWGLIALVSVNRGVEFPYPPGPYVLVAPLTLLGLDPRSVLQLGAALTDAVSAAVVYALATQVTGQRTALLAAAIYVFTAATFMTTWWSFSTHIYTQFLHLLLIAALGWALAVWQREGRSGGRAWALAVAVLSSLVFLGHFGFLINTALLLLMLTAAVWAASWRGAAWASRVRWPLTVAVAAAGTFTAVCFYSSYIPLFLSQLATAREGGLTAVAGRGPVSRAILWQRLWRDGLLIHFGLFPLLLMPIGLGLLVRRSRDEAGLGPKRAMLWLSLSSLSIAGGFAVFPFVAGVTNSPRWLMFIAWIVAVGAALAVEALWHWGWWGRLATVTMGALVLANTAWIWLGPMLWRMRPPEPF